jgi:hypothetical protein
VAVMSAAWRGVQAPNLSGSDSKRSSYESRWWACRVTAISKFQNMENPWEWWNNEQPSFYHLLVEYDFGIWCFLFLFCLHGLLTRFRWALYCTVQHIFLLEAQISSGHDKSSFYGWGPYCHKITKLKTLLLVHLIWKGLLSHIQVRSSNFPYFYDKNPVP